MIKACIFDMDGTTVDSVKSIAHYVNETLKKFGYSTVPVEKINYFAGNGPRALIERVFDYADADKSKLEEFLEIYKYSYNQDACYLSCPFDGIVPMLEDLRKSGIKTAIISNKQDTAVRMISNMLFCGLMDFCMGAKENVPLKPDPTSLLNAMKTLGVEKEEVLYVGDTDVDMITAKNAGVKSIGVLWGFRDKDELTRNGADYIVSHPSEISKLAKTI